MGIANVTLILVIALILLCLVTAGALADDDLFKVYPLSETGEAIVDDVSFYGRAPADSLDRVFYEIFVGSFADSDGDGILEKDGVKFSFTMLQRLVVGLLQVRLQRAAVQVFFPREHQDGAGQDALPEHLLEAPGHLLVLLGEAAELCHQEHRVRLRRRAGACLADALSGRPPRSPGGQDVGGVDDLQLPSLPRAAPLLEGLGHRASAELGLEHSPPEDAVSRGAFPAPGFSHQDEPQRLWGPFITPPPWKHREKVGDHG